MKKVFYCVYSLLFRVFRIFPVKENRVSLVSPHNSYFNDSLKFVKEGLEKRGEYDFNFVSSVQLGSLAGAVRFFTSNAYKTATSKYVFLNDNFMPFSGVNFSKKPLLSSFGTVRAHSKSSGLIQTFPTAKELLQKSVRKSMIISSFLQRTFQRFTLAHSVLTKAG